MKNEKFRTKDYVIGALTAVILILLTLLTHSEENLVSNFEDPVTEDLLENTLVIKSSKENFEIFQSFSRVEIFELKR